MKNLLYIIAVLLLIIWAFGFFLYALGGIIHTLLLLAVVALLVNAIRHRNAQP